MMINILEIEEAEIVKDKSSSREELRELREECYDLRKKMIAQEEKMYVHERLCYLGLIVLGLYLFWEWIIKLIMI